nr:flavin-containing monooxygenase FMO GS-OX-like 4 isoform X2 [Quercus suber]
MLRSPGHAPQPIVSRHVAVIGAGAAGLVTARELRCEGHSVVVFERGDQVGGTWVYTPNVESDPIGLEPTRTTVHSSLYDSLRTNIPREAMGFRDYPFIPKDDPDRDPRRFPGHREVLKYLQDFTNEFRIDELVRFETEVVRVRFMEEEEKWKIKSKERSGTEMGLELDEIFDAVVVCNGHFTEPRVAYIPGINEWPGKQMHSHNYRDSEPFRDQVVVLIGNSVSALDISWEVAGVAKEIHIAARTVIDGTFGKQPAYDNMWLHPMVEYNNWLASQCGCPAFEDWRMQMFLVTIKSTLAHLESYRDKWEAQHLVLQAYEDFIKHTSE